MKRHFISVCTVCLDKIDLHRKKYNILLKIIACDPSMYTMDHPIVCSFMENSIGLNRVNNVSIHLKMGFSKLLLYSYTHYHSSEPVFFKFTEDNKILLEKNWFYF